MSFSGFNKPSDIEDAYQRQLKLVRARVRNSQLLSKAELDKSQGIEPLVPPPKTTSQKLQDESFQVQLAIKNLSELLKDRDEVGKAISNMNPTEIRVVNQNFPYFMKDLGNYDLLTSDFFLDYLDNFMIKVKNSKGLISGLNPTEIAEALVEEAGKKLKNELGDAIDYQAVLQRLIALNQPVEVGVPATNIPPTGGDGGMDEVEGAPTEVETGAPVAPVAPVMIIPSSSIPVLGGVPSNFSQAQIRSIEGSLDVGGQWTYNQMKKFESIDIYSKLKQVNDYLNQYYDENGDYVDLTSTKNLRNIKTALRIGDLIITVIDRIRGGRNTEQSRKFIDKANNSETNFQYEDYKAIKNAFDSSMSELERDAQERDKPVAQQAEPVSTRGAFSPNVPLTPEEEEEVGVEFGFGLKKRMVNPRRLIQRMVKVGRGLKPETAEPRYVEWGDKFVIHKKQLGEGIFNIKYAKNFSTFHQIRPKRISMDLVDIIEDTIDSGRVNKKMYETLKDNDKDFFEKIIEIGGLSKKLGIRKSSNETFKKEMDRFELVRGQFIAGNNNPEVIKELKQFIIKFLMDNRITKGEGKELLLSLSTM